ncbi:MAG: phosphodiester glycosidase family protein [Terricaulis sp.]
MRVIPRTPRTRFALLAALLIVIAGVTACAVLRPHEVAVQPCIDHEFEGDDFVVCTFDTRQSEFRLIAAGPDRAYLRTFRALREALGDDAERVRFAMNAGMFNDAGAPIGLYVQNGQRLHPIRTTEGPGNFHMKPNGVFSLDASGVVRVEESEAFIARGEEPLWATQSGPMLVLNGALHPRIQHDGVSRLMRNGVGVRDAHTAFFVISEDAVSFGKFARFFRDQLHCPNALFLDGTVSSLWAPGLHRMDAGRPIGPMAVVLERARR